MSVSMSRDAGEPIIHLRGRELGSVFELVGRDENALTFALGWCLAKAPELTRELGTLLGLPSLTTGIKIMLQEHSGKNGITDIELRVVGQLGSVEIHREWITLAAR